MSIKMSQSSPLVHQQAILRKIREKYQHFYKRSLSEAEECFKKRLLMPINAYYSHYPQSSSN